MKILIDKDEKLTHAIALKNVILVTFVIKDDKYYLQIFLEEAFDFK